MLMHPARIRITLLTLLLLCAAMPCWTSAAHAHRLLVIAWVQDDRLMVETAFGNGQIAANMAITILDTATGEGLLSGTTDAEGLYEAALPPAALKNRHPLLVQATDGAGHMAEQTIAPEELPAMATPSTATPSLLEVSKLPEHSPDQLSPLFQQAVAEAVRQEIAPLRREILALSQRGPGIPEIVGGIGWIVGLAGLGAVLLRRNTQHTPSPR